MPRNSADFHQKSFRIKHEDDKFFTKLLSKETSKSNSSFRVYYGDVSSAVPFVWETRPGTPKLEIHETTIIPPLTPPPSYYNSINYINSSKKNSKSKMFLHTLLRRISRKKPHLGSSPSSSSLASLSFSSSYSSSYRDPMMSTSYGRFSSCGGDERVMDNRRDQGLGIGKNSEKKFHGYISSVYIMKKALLSIVGHRSA